MPAYQPADLPWSLADELFGLDDVTVSEDIGAIVAAVVQHARAGDDGDFWA